MGLTEAPLKLVQLPRGESGSVSFLFGIFVLESEEVLVLGLLVLVINVQPETVGGVLSVLVTVHIVPTERVRVGFGFPDLTALIK